MIRYILFIASAKILECEGSILSSSFYGQFPNCWSQVLPYLPSKLAIFVSAVAEGFMFLFLMVIKEIRRDFFVLCQVFKIFPSDLQWVGDII